MPKETVLCGFAFAVVSGLLLVAAPGMMSAAFVVVMIAATALAFWVGIHRVARFNQAFRRAAHEVFRAQEVQAEEVWLVVRQNPRLFGFSVLDAVFGRYRKDVDAVRLSGGLVVPDVEDYINEDTVALSTWRGVVLQVPGILTGIGILGTFVGLIVGVGGVGFSSVTAAINGVQTLLAGIEVAFFTSIAGLIFSILFNIAYRIVWNVMVRNLQQFTLDFQALVVPSAEAQELRSAQAYRSRVVELLSTGKSL